MVRRDSKIDSLKFILICLVIFGHCLEIFSLHMTPVTNHLYQFIYLFHMPLFVFISGYFMNKSKSKEAFCKSLLLLLETYLVFQLPSYLLASIHGLKSPIVLLNPSWAMWYLPALIAWRLIVYMIPDKVISNIKLTIPILLCMCLIGGFINYREFAFQRILSYFPMFMMGYYCKEKNWLPKIEKVPIWITLSFCALVIVCLFIINPSTSVLFYQNNSYYTQPIPAVYGLLFRFCWYIITFILSSLLLPLLLRFDNEKFSYYGRYTLLFYVCHIFFLSYFRVAASKLGILSIHWLFIVVFAFLLATLCLISKSKYARYITNPISSLILNKSFPYDKEDGSSLNKGD